MKFCPNRSHPVYKEMVAKLGEDKAMQAYLLNRFEIPSSLQEAERILEKDAKGLPIVPESLVKKIKEALVKQRAMYAKEHQGAKLIQQIDNILFNLEQGNRYEGMLYLIRSANSMVNAAEQRIIDVKQKLVNAEYDKLSEAEKKDIATLIGQLKEFVSTYSILDDIRMQVFRQDGSSTLGPDSDLLMNAINRRTDIIMDYRNLSYTLTVKWLKPQLDRVNNNLIRQGKGDMVITEERLAELLKSADMDANVITKLLGTVANSKDPVLGLVASTIKRELETMRQVQIERQGRLYNLYEGKPGSKGSQEEFNKPYYHYIENKEYVQEYDKDGKPIMLGGKPKTIVKFVRRAAFHTPLRTDLFEKAKYNFFEALKEEYGGQQPTYGTKEYGEWTKKVSNWFRDNTELVDTKALIAEKKATLSPQQFQRWLEDNTTEIDNIQYDDGTTTADYYQDSEIYSKNRSTVVIYSGQFKQPKYLKYRNTQFEKLVASDPYYKELYNEYKVANDKLHPSRKLKHGIIPQVLDDRRNAYIKNPVKALKSDWSRSWNLNAYDQEFGVITPSGELRKYVPIHYTYLLDDADLSKDLLQSVMQFSEMADNYKSMNGILPNVSILTDLIKGNVRLGIDPRTALGVKDAVSKAKWTEADASAINSQLIEFLDKVVYGEGEIPDKIPGTNISLNKLARKAGALTSAIQLMGNVTSAVNNLTIGNFQNLLQSVGSKYFSAGDYASATGTYTSSLPSLMQDVANGIPRSKLGVLAEMYDAIQGNFTDQYGRKISGNMARRLLTTDAGYFLMKGSEQQIQYTGMIALMKGQKVKYKGQTITLWEAYDEKGKLKQGVEWSEDDRFNFMQKLHKMNKELHGVYNKFDSPSLQRRWYGKLALMFRKYLYSTIRKRWGGQYIDMEEGDWAGGYYRIFFNKALQSFKDMSLEAYHNATPDERIAINKALIEMSAFFVINMLILGLSGLDDDDEDLATQHFELQLRRLSDDVGFYLADVNAMMRILRTPAVSMNIWEKLYKATKQTLIAPTEVYERKPSKYSIYEKGDYKALKYWNDVLPISNKLEDLIDPSGNLSFIKQQSIF
jgi:hypothetical protein